ncbi:MAG: aminotransferase class I/II-fold pyridoxal phosphate-dependent enzyme, partial [Duncaniella sp.]|nr:aminotransferase class I/II-fold pyridoxal phosphate-dependent enzyme [Duncaniella sp.]
IYLENKVKALTGAHDVVAFSSGMAAISNTLMAVAAAGRNIVTSRHMFGNTYLLITGTLARFGVGAHLVDLCDLEAVEKAVDGDTCCIYLETITNPQMEVADLRGLAEICRRHGIPLIADTTMIPFTEFDSRALGIDIEVVSSTKYLSGGATSLGGLVIDYGTVDGFSRRMRTEMLLNLGAYMTPHAAYMQTIGLETLSARYAVQASNALALARRLRDVPGVEKVTYIGLEDNPYHGVALNQFGPTGSAMLTIDLADKDACFRFINRLKLIRRATNLFDNKTLAIHPASTIFGPLSQEQRDSMDILDTTIRLSLGLEDVDDLYDDITQALGE